MKPNDCKCTIGILSLQLVTNLYFDLTFPPRNSLRFGGDLIDADAGPAVFVKMQKSGQDHRLDTPFVGAETMRAAAAVGINILAIESGAVMLADDLQKLADICNDYGMSFVGISAAAET